MIDPKEGTVGLDFVELVMTIEDEFDLRIPDELATGLTTVGKTVAWVLTELRKRPFKPSPCASSRCFYQLREALVTRLGALRRSVRLETPIEQLVDLNQR